MNKAKPLQAILDTNTHDDAEPCPNLLYFISLSAIHTYSYIHTYVQTYIPAYIPTYKHAYIHTYIHTYMLAHIHKYTHTHTYKYTHTCTYTDTSTYAYARVIHANLNTSARPFLKRAPSGFLLPLSPSRPQGDGPQGPRGVEPPHFELLPKLHYLGLRV